jgi:transcriptional regulator with XRE-family HTH domain
MRTQFQFLDGLTKGEPMETPKTVADLCRQHTIDARQLAEKSGLEETRVMAIVLGRWTPSPAERAAVAGVFGLTPEQVVWGHSTPIQHIYGSGPA